MSGQYKSKFKRSRYDSENIFMSNDKVWKPVVFKATSAYIDGFKVGIEELDGSTSNALPSTAWPQ
jgi:hypothetical protein